jgi:hypothetical protein
MNTEHDEFSVCQFFRDGTYEYVCRFVSAEEAVRTAKDYSSNVSAQTGRTARVIITDGGDCINLEWQHGKGITYPPQEEIS